MDALVELYGHIPRFFSDEASASLIRHVQPLAVTGLLQTEDYTPGDQLERAVVWWNERGQ